MGYGRHLVDLLSTINETAKWSTSLADQNVCRIILRYALSCTRECFQDGVEAVPKHSAVCISGHELWRTKGTSLTQKASINKSYRCSRRRTEDGTEDLAFVVFKMVLETPLDNNSTDTAYSPWLHSPSFWSPLEIWRSVFFPLSNPTNWICG